ncbi:hypothetical protein E2K93_17245 [Thalassotalea sp. HSM 43]|uniref:hypothetical protein n=1 Tax=Thalassotalea sp. HSM 43 TaxID=2552945 RepID=UPI00107FE74E|nr:hypothetical protein [Thalassotalea sp. HSM 43]QBY06002.1 hypothetical protein E2K93_17245 [Thalassotalea sp. HSM 43]
MKNRPTSQNIKTFSKQPCNIKSLKATVVKGHQIASGQNPNTPYKDGSIVIQAPLFKQHGVNIDHMYKATINLDIAPYQLSIVEPDHQIIDLPWCDAIAPETFSFCHCQLNVNEQTYAGLIYYPHPETKPDHFQRAHVVEVIAPFIKEIQYGSQVTLNVAAKHISPLTD